MNNTLVNNKTGVPILIQLMGICLAMIIVVVCGIYFYLSPLFERELLNNEKRHIQSMVESTHSLVADYHQRFKNGEIDEKEAKKRALGRI